jgi:hypothetical protein
VKRHIIEKQGLPIVRISGLVNGRDSLLIRRVQNSGISERQPKVVLDMGDLDGGGSIAAHMRSFQALADQCQWLH